MKKLKNKNFAVVSLDKKPGGISKMIELSSKALSLHCNEITIIVTDKILKNHNFT